MRRPELVWSRYRRRSAMMPPYPTPDLANRVGHTVDEDGSFTRFDAVGRATRDALISALPRDWSWRGKRVLDFGCGPGRTLRHLVAEGHEAEIWGCDIDAESVAWINEHLNPPVRAFPNGELPPIQCPAQHFDLVYAFSVFSHITDAWSAWVAELHRILAPDGFLIASFLGAGMIRQLADEPWDEARIGMNVLAAHRGWDQGGPTVLLSSWWIREHWGRAFEILEIRDSLDSGTHGLVVAKRRGSPCSTSGLERISADPREHMAMRHQIVQLGRESERQSSALEDAVRGYENSRSWRLTRPLRTVSRRLRS